MNAQQERKEVNKCADLFPPTFGLLNFPGKTFKIDRNQSFYSEGSVQLYTFILNDDGKWLAFAKGTVTELRRNIVP